MDWREAKRLKAERQKQIREMTDSEKLSMIIDILKKEDDINMFTDGSDTYGIDFTREYEEWQEDIEEFLGAVE